MPLRRGFAAVAFDELAWQEDLRRTTGSAKRIGEETRLRLEREGQPVEALFACNPEARDGTRLPNCVKVYLPPPGGPLGLVFRIAKSADERLYLDHLAFGMRHVPAGSRGESVYQSAHRRLNG
ncbi:MAG TPA: hypothetical protein VFN92_09015 [Solirubrobacterales bacterium]|nr:hypothetical protein [Solirubrobacterales bacterium]